MSSVAPTPNVEQPTVVVIKRHQSSLKLILALGGLLLVSFLFLDYSSITGLLSTQTLPVQRSSTQQGVMVTDASVSSTPSTESMSSVISASTQQRMLGWIKEHAVQVAVFSVAVMMIIALVVALVVVLTKPGEVAELEEVITPKPTKPSTEFDDEYESSMSRLGFWGRLVNYIGMDLVIYISTMAVCFLLCMLVGGVYYYAAVRFPNSDYKPNAINDIKREYELFVSKNGKEGLEEHVEKVFTEGPNSVTIKVLNGEGEFCMNPTDYTSRGLNRLLAHYGEKGFRGEKYKGPYIFLISPLIWHEPSSEDYCVRVDPSRHQLCIIEMSDDVLQHSDRRSLDDMRLRLGRLNSAKPETSKTPAAAQEQIIQTNPQIEN